MSGFDGARYIAESLQGYGATHVFFVDAILRRTLVELEALGVKRVLSHSEKAAAYMADGYARATGRPGICMAQSVGAANLAAGLQDAYLQRAPIIALTGRRTSAYRYRNAYQEVDHAPLYESVTKFHAEVAVADQLPVLLPQAFREATEGTPRPVHLDLGGRQGEAIEASTMSVSPIVEKLHARVPARRSPPNAADINAAVELIRQARKPVAVCGAGAVQSRAHEAVQSFAEQLQVPVATSTGGHGIVPTMHPLHIGIVGSYSASCANEIVHAADLVIFVGCHTGDQVTHNWAVPASGTPIVQIDVDAREIGRNYPNVCGIVGDPRLTIAALRAACKAHAPFSSWAAQASTSFASWRDSMAWAETTTSTPIRVERLCYDIAHALPDDGVLVADTGYSAIWTANLIEMPYSGQTYMRAAGSLGWSFPAALGAKCGVPNRPVVCFTGDGAFYYHLAELETARRHNISVVVIVNNNSGFAQGISAIRSLYSDRQGNADELIRFGPTDFSSVARSFGVEGVRIDDPAEVRPALLRALSLGKPIVLDVVTDPEPRAPTPWSPPERGSSGV